MIPGIDPWEQVLRNPYLWHFAFHSIPELPELLVQGHQSEYAKAYATDSALPAGLNWYRTFPQDAATNREP